VDGVSAAQAASSRLAIIPIRINRDIIVSFSIGKAFAGRISVFFVPRELDST
jgi:hypothetical protein